MKTIMIACAFAGWCGFVLAAPFVALGAGVMSPAQFEGWIPLSYAASWRVSVPPFTLFLSAFLLGAWQRYPVPAKVLASVGGVALGLLLMDRGMRSIGGQFDGLMEILALLLGSAALVAGFVLGEFIRRRRQLGRSNRPLQPTSGPQTRVK